MGLYITVTIITRLCNVIITLQSHGWFIQFINLYMFILENPQMKLDDLGVQPHFRKPPSLTKK